LHPSAYSRHGWSNMVYVGSTRRVEVGELWLEEARLYRGWPDAVPMRVSQLTKLLGYRLTAIESEVATPRVARRRIDRSLGKRLSGIRGAP